MNSAHTDRPIAREAHIGNLPAADVNVEFPSGEVKTVNLLILLAQAQHAEMMAKFGHGIARNAPTLREIRAQYEIPASAARSWKALAPKLRQFYTDLRAATLDE